MSTSTRHFNGCLNSDRGTARSLHVWELSTESDAVGLNDGATRIPTVAAFSGDASRLAVGALRGEVFVRSLRPGGRDPLLPEKTIEIRHFDGLWICLDSQLGETGYAAMWELLKSPEQALGLLETRLKPMPPREIAEAEGWIRDLTHREFEKRYLAKGNLRREGWRLRPLLRHSLEVATAAQARKDLKDVLIDVLTGKPREDQLAQSRAIQVLEMMNSAESRKSLGQLAAGATGATSTAEAGSALGRLK